MSPFLTTPPSRIVVIGALAALLSANAPATTDPFETAAMAPPDVTLFVHVKRAAEIRRELADRPIAQWINASLADGNITGAWTRLAKSAQADSGRLFDQCLGDEFTIIARRTAASPDTSTLQWALITHMPDAVSEKMLRQLKARVREPRHSMALAELPEEAMLIARDGDWMVVGPVDQSTLFDEVLQRMGKAGMLSLREDESMTRAQELGDGCAAVFLRHAQPLGGWSAAVADLHGDQLTIRHAASFESSPFMRGITKLTCDFSPVLGFEKSSLLAMMQPMDVADGPYETFLNATAGQNLITRSVRENLGNRKMMVFNESSGPPPQQPAEALAGSLVSCLELKNAAEAAPQLERQLTQAASRNECLARGALLVPAQPAAGVESTNSKPLAAPEWLTGGFPVMNTVKLCWTVADGPRGCWFVIASNPQNMNSVAAVLKGNCATEPCFVGRFDSCGVGSGVRISKQLQTWTDQSRQLAEPGRAEDFTTTLGAMSALAAGVQNCHWQLARPTANEMRLDVQITLTPPDSARSGD